MGQSLEEGRLFDELHAAVVLFPVNLSATGVDIDVLDLRPALTLP